MRDFYSTQTRSACTCATTAAASIRQKATRVSACREFGKERRAWEENSRLLAPRDRGPQFRLSYPLEQLPRHSQNETYGTKDSRSHRRRSYHGSRGIGVHYWHATGYGCRGRGRKRAQSCRIVAQTSARHHPARSPDADP